MPEVWFPIVSIESIKSNFQKHFQKHFQKSFQNVVEFSIDNEVFTFQSVEKV